MGRMAIFDLPRLYCQDYMITVVARLQRRQMIKLRTAECSSKNRTRRCSAGMLKHLDTFYRNKKRTSKNSTEPVSHRSRTIDVDMERSVTEKDTVAVTLHEKTHRCRKQLLSSLSRQYPKMQSTQKKNDGNVDLLPSYFYGSLGVPTNATKVQLSWSTPSDSNYLH